MCIGRRTDARIYRHSGLDTILRMHAKGRNGRQLCIFADQGYAHSTVVQVPYGKSLRMSRKQRNFNVAMSQVRIAVEHEFGKIRNFFRFTQYVGECSTYFFVP